MRRILLTLLGAIVVIGVLAGAGFAGYRIGFRQGEQISANGAVPRPVRPDQIDPFHNFDRDFERGFNRDFPRGFRMIGRGGFGFFRPLMFLAHLAFWGLIILLVYWLFTRSGWRITRTEQTVKQTPPNTQTVTTIQEEETKNE